MLEGRDIAGDEELGKHADWVEELKEKYGSFERGTIDRIIEDEVGLVFSKVLEHAGVYKRTPEGQAAFGRFIEAVNGLSLIHIL